MYLENVKMKYGVYFKLKEVEIENKNSAKRYIHDGFSVDLMKNLKQKLKTQ